MKKNFVFSFRKLLCPFSCKLIIAVFYLSNTTQSLQAQVVNLSPVADAFIRNGSYANTNYGNDTSLTVKSSVSSGFTRLSYLKFSLAAISNIKSAKVRLYGLNKDDATTINLSVYGVDDDSWTENSITFNNAPAPLTSSLISGSVNNVGAYYEFDITGFVKAQLAGDKVVTILIKDANNKNKTIVFNSKENSQNTPQLSVDVSPAAQPVILTSIADAFVRNGSYSNINYGSDTSLVVKATSGNGFTRSSFIKFSLASVSNLRSAKVRLYGLNKDNATAVNINLFGVNDDSWTEAGITFNNAPPLLTSSLSSVFVNNAAGYYEFDITDFARAKLAGNKLVSIVLKDTLNKNINIFFNSKENSQNPPQLVLDTAVSNARLFVENIDKFPSNDNFVFSHIQVPWTRDSVYNANHDSSKLRIHNNGINPLIISNLLISNDTLWKIEKLNGIAYNPATQLPATVNSGGTLDLIIKFIAKNLGTSSTRVKVLNETLSITSNDDRDLVKKIYLHGIWQYSGEGSQEPSSQEMITAFGYKTKTGFGATDPNSGDTTKLKGDEIKPSYFVRADALFPVTIRQMAAYHGCCQSTEKFEWFTKGTPTYNSAFSHIGLDGQTLLPRKSISGSPAEGSITPSGAFGIRIGTGNTTDASLNTGKKIGVRVYKVFDASGIIIPNTYILANDYLGSSSNYDYNDNLYYITNVKPYTGTVYYSLLNTAPSNLDFGEHVLQTGDSLLLNISSGGKTYSNGTQDPPLTVTYVTIAGENQSEFSAYMPLKTTLNSQEATTIKVKFNPLSQGLKIADLLIYYNNSQIPKRVPLYGIAKATGVTVTANYRVNSGASSPVTINGKTWAADNQYSFENLEPYKNSALQEITATDEDALYVDEQSSNADKAPFRYQFPVANGDYYVRLHFAEIYWGAPGGLSGGTGSRVFSVKLENQQRLINYDVTQDVGGATAVIKNFPVTVTDGNLNIDFSSVINRPMVCAVEVYSFNNLSGRPDHVATVQNNPAVAFIVKSNSADFEKPHLYPNPTRNNNFNIQFPVKYEGLYHLQLLDLVGRKFELGKIKLIAGGSVQKINISKFSLAPGVYFLRIKLNSNRGDILKVLIE